MSVMGTTNSTPLVTVAIPVYNRGHFLRDAIESALRQSYQHIELLIVDDASTEDIENIVRFYKDPRIRFARNEVNLGLVANFNRCLTLARGEIINVLHSDDELASRAVERAVEWFASRDNLGLVCSSLTEADTYVPAGQQAAAELADHGVEPVSSAFLARHCIEQCGLYDQAYPYSPDMEYFPRIACAFDIVIVGGLARARHHSARTMIQTWRREDFLHQYRRVKTAAWRHVGLDEQQVQQHVSDSVAVSCIFIADFLWGHGASRSDNALGRFYFDVSRRYRISVPPPTRWQRLTYWSSFVPCGYRVATFTRQSLVSMERRLHGIGRRIGRLLRPTTV